MTSKYNQRVRVKPIGPKAVALSDPDSYDIVIVTGADATAAAINWGDVWKWIKDKGGKVLGGGSGGSSTGEQTRLVRALGAIRVPATLL